MNHIFKFFAYFLTFVSCFPVLGQDMTEPPVTINLPIQQLKSSGYSGQTPDKTKQPITTKKDALEFIRNITTQHSSSLAAIKGQLDIYIKDLDHQGNDKSAVILIKHPVKLEKLYAGDSPDAALSQSKLAGEYNTINSRKIVKQNLIASIDSKIISIEDNSRLTPGNPATEFDPTKLLPASVAELNNLKVLRSSTSEEISNLNKQLSEIQKAFINVSSEIEEEEKIETLILDFNDQEWSDYLYNVDKVLFVLVGGLNDIQKGKLTIDNKPSSFETSLNQTLQVAAGLGLGIPIPVGTSIPGVKLKDTIPVTFLLVKRKKIQAPSTLTFNIEEKEMKAAFEVHEKMRFGLQLGVSATQVERKNFVINQNNELTISVDEENKEEWKSNLYVLLEFIPWGRDIDRLEPIFSKNKNIKVLDINRLGLIGGLKLSKNPLEALYGGFSYALSKSTALNFGLSMHATPRSVTDLPVGINASLDYLKENAETELEPKIFFGVSFSPIIIGRSLGIVKE